MLGSLKLCDIDLVKVLIRHLKTAHGEVTTWDESQMAEYSNLLGKCNTQHSGHTGQNFSN